MKIAVIGAGPAGITAAYQLSKHIKDQSIELDVYEASENVGGLSRSISLWGQVVDLGPHRFFSSDKRVNDVWLEVVKDDYKMVDRLTRIFYSNKFFSYPLKPMNALGNLGLLKASQCMLSFFYRQVFPYPHNDTFEAWVSNRFGDTLFNIFFKSYSEKLWGISCKELDADFAAQRIKKLSLLSAVWNAFFPKGGGEHKTLVDAFAYPTEGSGMVYERMAEHIRENGGAVYLNTPVESVKVVNNEVKGVVVEGQLKEYDQVISTMPLTLLVNAIAEAPKPVLEATAQLKFRNTILVYLNVEGKDLYPDQWLYVHSDKLKTGRITNFSNWIPDINKGKEDTIVCLEYWANLGDDFWKQDDRSLIELAKKEMISTGLLKGANITKGKVIRLPRCYPIYETGYKVPLKKVEDYVSSIKNLNAIGRYGAFKYNNQDHSILMGLKVAENLVEGTDNNLWNINTDYDTYQESSVITKTGLEEKNN